MSAVSRIPCRQDMKDCNDHKGDLSGKIHEDDDYQHHRDSPGVSAMNVWIYRHCISSRIKKPFLFNKFILPRAEMCNAILRD